ncbi:hypothetical protein BSKO_11781 [Bryopsis sp. KO-2023]|nr:hypothetical protein BSKO_11781 [Bryopsis sp. KO-2023]
MELKGKDRYDQAKLKELEASVGQQVSSGSYGLDVNMALLRFYQINPESTNAMLVAKILCKALMQLPDPDFKLCLHLLPEKVQNEEPIATLVLLAGHLSAARFPQFWAAADMCKELLNSVPKFYDAIRAYVLHVVGISYQKILMDVLGPYLKLEGKDLQKLVDAKVRSGGWSVVDTPGGKVIQLSLNSENQHTSKVVVGGHIGFDQVTPLIRALRQG